MLFKPRQKGLGSENFLKLNDREEVSGFFRGEIYSFRRHWHEGRGVECTGNDCPICAIAPENKPASRYRINFVTSKDGQWIPKIFEFGNEIYDSLVDKDKKYDLLKTAVEITRRGLKTNTKYEILPLVNYPVTKEIEAKLKNVTLLPLSSERPDESAEG
jgi:hypothetical protein